MSENQIAVLLCAALAVAFAWAVRAINGTVEGGKHGINPALGIRTSATMHCEECWDAGHRAAGAPLRRMRLPVALLGLAALPAALLESVIGPAPAWIAVIAGWAWAMAAVFVALRAANAAARELHPAGSLSGTRRPR